MDIPIEDAVTIAYVDLVHAVSELNHINVNQPGAKTLDEIDGAVEDIHNAMITLYPHVARAQAQRV